MVCYEAESLRLVAVEGLSLTLHFSGLLKLILFDCCLPLALQWPLFLCVILFSKPQVNMDAKGTCDGV